MDGKPDAEQLAFAASQGRVLYTRNTSDFARLHAFYLMNETPHFGILLRSRTNYSVGEQSRRILNLWEAMKADEMINRLEFLSAWGRRP